MKNGELLALAQLIVPELTAKAFVQFYNIAFEKISREVRLLTTVLRLTSVSLYKNLLEQNAVKIDSVKDASGDDIFWEVRHRKLLIYDSNKELITDATIGNHKLEIEYWVRISKAIKLSFPTDDDIESNPNIIEEWNEMIPGVEDTEVQLCALYLMITELAGIFPMEPGTVELYANKFSGAFQAVKTKYNSGNSPATITQVYF
ncbi:MAG: hypothetical protein LC101_04830 [Flavobacteriales bacterium]|nr:hypothetical protein [Flavobacteriales bacterium]